MALGIVAGAGDLPRLIAEGRAAAGEAYLVCAFEGAAPEWIASHPHVVAPIEKPGRLFAALRKAGVERVVFAGGMARPQLRPLAFDMTALRLAPRIMTLLKQGDDALLRGLADVFEDEGFRLVGAHELLGHLVAPEGALSGRAPDAEDCEDIARAAELTQALGALDVGQGAVVAGGLCLGLETVQGTDALIDFAGRTPDRLRRRPGILFKAPKPGQDWRVDLPAVGVETLRRAAAAGLAGVAVQAGGVLVLGLDVCRAEADRLGVFLYGWRA